MCSPGGSKAGLVAGHLWRSQVRSDGRRSAVRSPAASSLLPGCRRPEPKKCVRGVPARRYLVRKTVSRCHSRNCRCGRSVRAVRNGDRLAGSAVELLPVAEFLPQSRADQHGLERLLPQALRRQPRIAEHRAVPMPRLGEIHVAEPPRQTAADAGKPAVAKPSHSNPSKAFPAARGGVEHRAPASSC